MCSTVLSPRHPSRDGSFDCDLCRFGGSVRKVPLRSFPTMSWWLALCYWVVPHRWWMKRSIGENTSRSVSNPMRMMTIMMAITASIA